ncbi:Branched-chain amino acid transport system 2 carrier protein, partial [Haemophilus influenzae]
PHFLPQ